MERVVETKKCSGCNRELPATREYFHKSVSGRLGLHHYCKQCMRERYPDRGHKKGRNDGGAMMLNINMAPYSKMFDLLKRRAKEEIRTVEGQALFYIVKGLGETVLEKKHGEGKK